MISRIFYEEVCINEKVHYIRRRTLWRRSIAVLWDKKYGNIIKGIEVFNFEKLFNIWEDYEVTPAVSGAEYLIEMCGQLTIDEFAKTA